MLKIKNHAILVLVYRYLELKFEETSFLSVLMNHFRGFWKIRIRTKVKTLKKIVYPTTNSYESDAKTNFRPPGSTFMTI